MALSAKNLRWIGRAIRAFVVLLYLGWIIIGLCILRNRQVDPAHLQYQAVRDLPVGHRLRAGDFRYNPQIPPRDRSQLPPESHLVGKYLRHQRCRDQALALEDVTTAPVTKVARGKLSYFFSLQNQMDLVDVLNAGSHVAVYGGAKSIEDARVVSIVCSEPPSPKCSAVLELSKEQVALISGHNKENYRLVLHGDLTR